MATHKQAIKRHKQSLVRNERNRYFKTSCRTFMKIAREAIAAGDKSAAHDAVQRAVVMLDRAAGKGILPHNRASRVKGRLMAQVAKL